MKCVIVYFSQTGNTEKVARAIQKGIIEAAGNCDIFKVKEANPRQMYQYDLIGIGSPVNLGESPVVTAFIKNLWSVGGKHAFAFATHGTMPQFFAPKIIPKIKRRGLIVIGVRTWFGACYLPWHPEPYPTAGHPDEIDLKEAEEFGKEMVDHSRRVSAGETGLIPPPPAKIPAVLDIDLKKDLPKLGVKDTSRSIFKYHKELCKYPKCRLCMDNCPMYGIDLSLKQPVIAKPCIKHCVFCTLVCPTGALEIDDFIKEQAPCYRHTTETLALPNLDKLEAEGKFRRLIPKDKIGFDTMFYQVHSGHPKWIIGKGIQ